MNVFIAYVLSKISPSLKPISGSLTRPYGYLKDVPKMLSCLIRDDTACENKTNDLNLRTTMTMKRTSCNYVGLRHSSNGENEYN